jgi:sugar O-acyltransferase (sialic acid O-acetyltransferase NeuD family)
MKKLLIIGGGGFGREVLCWALDMEPHQDEWKIGGFLDDNPAALDGFGFSYPIVGAPANYVPSSDDVFICAIGAPAIKMRICNKFEKMGARFISLIHPTATVGRNNNIGYGCILCPHSCITTNVTLGNFVTLNLYSCVGHEAIVGEGTTLSAHCDVTGNTRLGKGIFLGSHAAVLPGASVGDHAVVGAGSVVLRKVKPGATVMGVPARQVAGFSASD